MLHRKSLVVSILLLSSLVAIAKDKKKNLLPADILQARTAVVLVDPTADVDMKDPNANQNARDSVEKALMVWGRYSIAPDIANADIVITVRKGGNKVAQGGIGGVPMNNRPVTMSPNNNGGRMGGGIGASPGGDPSDSEPSGPRPEVEVGGSQDMFVVYRGNRAKPLDSPAVWRYSAPDALQTPGIPAVDQFKKLITESEKQLAAKP
jgi:hypothetical protein